MRHFNLGVIKDRMLFSQHSYYTKIIKVSKKANETPKKHFIKKTIYRIKQNRLSPKRNIWILGHIGNDIIIYHQNIIINSHANVGNGVIFHGNNMIGNDGKNLDKAPKIGDNVEFGYGASVIGDVSIANGVIIGAHALVTKSVEEENVIVAGIPAKIIRKKNDE